MDNAMSARPMLAALLLGAVSAFGFEPVGYFFLTFIALGWLLVLIARAPGMGRAFGLGWAFGAGHFAVGLNWIATAFTYQAAMPAWLGWIAVVTLSLYLAVYPALAAWGAWQVARLATIGRFRGSAKRQRNLMPGGSLAVAAPIDTNNPHVLQSLIFAFSALWVVTEWLRSWVFTGFAWNPLSAAAPTEAMSIAVWVGSYGASAVLILLAGALLFAVHSHWRRSCNLAITVILLGGAAWFVVTRAAGMEMAYAPMLNRQPANITIVQPNVGQQDKWQGDKADANFAKLAELTRPLSNNPRLILWPEAAIPDYLETGYPWVYYERSPAEARARLTDLMGPDDIMLLGALKLETDKAGEVVGARNSVMLVRPDGTLGSRYDKAHLVPYGEYLPMRPILSAIGLSRLAPGDLDFWPGPGPRTINTGRFGKAGIQICYEIIFSGQVVDQKNRPDFIFNPSNDAWFGSWGPPQHLAQARLRALEEGLPVIRSTPTGISAIIDARGQIVHSIPMGAAERIDAPIPAAGEPTLFARYGNICSLIFAGLLLALAIASGRLRR
jgi:apolipoprotein N-acyltransferase